MLKIYKSKKDDLLTKILKSNFTRAVVKVRTALMELKVLTADAPAEMPAEDVAELEKFIKETDEKIQKII